MFGIVNPIAWSLIESLLIATGDDRMSNMFWKPHLQNSMLQQILFEHLSNSELPAYNDVLLQEDESLDHTCKI